jgi:hypothetical protein
VKGKNVPKERKQKASAHALGFHLSKCNDKFGDYLLLNSIVSALNTSSFFGNVHDECSSFLEIVFFKRISFYSKCLN